MKIKLVAQVVKVDESRFTMFVMPEFVSPSRYIYSVDNEYNGVVIRGECYDRQFMFGKGAGNYIIADISLRNLARYRSLLDAPDIFLANIPVFFLDKDD